jgi:hypothetical protein
MTRVNIGISVQPAKQASAFDLRGSTGARQEDYVLRGGVRVMQIRPDRRYYSIASKNNRGDFS